MKKSVLLFLLLLPGLYQPLFSQGIQGMVRDSNGEAIPYAAIFIKELTRGTTCNALGNFSLPLPEGNYTIYFRSLGYSEVSKEVLVGPEYSTMNIQLPPQTYMIPEVRISASGEDPAYWIMRKAIGLANYHLNEVSNYHADIYIKGTAILDKIPKALEKRMEVNDVEVEEGKAYMMESFNQVEFNAPDKYDMRILASQNTLPGYTDNVNPMDYVNASLYQQQIENVISPLARNAFSHYKFSWEGTFMEGAHLVNKIRVKPRRKSQQLVDGTIFVVEDLWCLHSSDLSVSTIAGHISLQQLYANVMMDAWLPVNHKLVANIEIVGIKGRATYVSSLEYTDVNLNPNLPETYFQSLQKDEPAKEEELTKNEKKMNELLQKEELSNREMARLSKLMEEETEKANEENGGKNLDITGTSFTIDTGAVKNDSLYWNVVRPIPLTPEEHVTIQTKDSIIGSRISSNADSTDAGPAKKRWFRKLIFGSNMVSNNGRVRLRHTGLIDLDQVDFNTVDGFTYGQEFMFRWYIDSVNHFRSSLLASYAFHRKAPQLSWNSFLFYAPMRRGKLMLSLDYRSADFNETSGIPRTTNLMYTLFLRQNHLKLFEKISAKLYNRIDLANGLALRTYLEAGKHNQLGNNLLFSFFYRDANEERFTDNHPPGMPADAPSLQDHYRMLAGVSLEYTPEQYYEIRRHRKEYRQSVYPTFLLGYERALPLESSGWSDFSSLEAGIHHSMEVGLLSELEWHINAGLFLDTTAVHFSDYKHFKASPLYVDMAGLENALMFTDYYQSSTSEYWVKVQARLNSSYLLIKYLPWFSQRLWTESLDLAYLHTPGEINYLQAGYSMNEIFFMLDIGIYAGFGEDNLGNWAYRGITGRLNIRF